MKESAREARAHHPLLGTDSDTLWRLAVKVTEEVGGQLQPIEPSMADHHNGQTLHVG